MAFNGEPIPQRINGQLTAINGDPHVCAMAFNGGLYPKVHFAIFLLYRPFCFLFVKLTLSGLRRNLVET